MLRDPLVMMPNAASSGGGGGGGGGSGGGGGGGSDAAAEAGQSLVLTFKLHHLLAFYRLTLHKV